MARRSDLARRAVVDADDNAGPNAQHRRVMPIVVRLLVFGLLVLGSAQAQAPIDPATMQLLGTDSFFRQQGKGSGKVSGYRSEQLVAFERQPR